MKKSYITIILSLSVSCSNIRTISGINDYITKIDKRNDLFESIIEYETTDLKGKITGGISIYKLINSENKIYRLRAETIQENLPTHYDFYFKKDILTFAKVIQFDLSRRDTIINSKYYYVNSRLIKQINLKKGRMNHLYLKKKLIELNKLK